MSFFITFYFFLQLHYIAYIILYTFTMQLFGLPGIFATQEEAKEAAEQLKAAGVTGANLLDEPVDMLPPVRRFEYYIILYYIVFYFILFYCITLYFIMLYDIIFLGIPLNHFLRM